MDSETASETDQPGWYRLLPALVLVTGLLLTFLLWMETRHALISEARESATPLHQLQAQRLDNQLTRHEELLELLATDPAASPADNLLSTMAGWHGLLRLRSGNDGALRITGSRLTEDAPDALKQTLMEQAFWAPVRERLPDNVVVATPHFSVDGNLVQGLVVATDTEDGPEYLISLFSPETLIADNLKLGERPRLQISVIDLQQHDHAPIYTSDGEGSGPVHETTINLGDRQWLVRGRSVNAVAVDNASLFLNSLMFGGTALSIALALLAWQLVRYHRLNIRKMVRVDRLRDRDRRALENKRVEKEVMSRALSDSEQRTRDFIQLGGGIGFELDDEHAIGYVSSQVQPLLGRAPSDLAGLFLTDLLPESEHQRLTDAFHSSRRERTITRLDTVLAHQDGTNVPVRIQICTVCDALSQCQGYRAVAWPHQPH